jgi:hypothetical protein
MEFKIDFKEVEVTLDYGTEKEKCKIKEFTGKSRDQYLSFISDKVVFSPTGAIEKINSADGLQSFLLSLCLYHASGKLFTKTEIEDFPAEIVDKLYAEANKICGLSSNAAVEVKND